jgi:molybdopterin synthase sulfur carrier subunit
MKVKLRWVALLRDERGTSHEDLEWPGGDLAALYAELCRRHGLSLPQERVLVALNEEFAQWGDHPSQGDEVIFLPPVAGG